MFHVHTLTWCLCRAGRRPASVAGRRRSTSNVWRTAWPCWRTRTKPSSRNSKPSKTCTATNLSRNVTERLAGPTPSAPVYRDSAQSHASGCHAPLFYSLAFFLKTAEKSVKWLDRNLKENTPTPTFDFEILFPSVSHEKVRLRQDGRVGGGYNSTGSFVVKRWNRLLLFWRHPSGSIPVTGAWMNRATSPATRNRSTPITTTDRTF